MEYKQESFAIFYETNLKEKQARNGVLGLYIKNKVINETKKKACLKHQISLTQWQFRISLPFFPNVYISQVLSIIHVFKRNKKNKKVKKLNQVFKCE